jgi:hypothetical protein
VFHPPFPGQTLPPCPRSALLNFRMLLARQDRFDFFYAMVRPYRAYEGYASGANVRVLAN